MNTQQQEAIERIRAMRSGLLTYEGDTLWLVERMKGMAGQPECTRALEAIQKARHELREALGEMGRYLYQEEEE